MKVVITGAELFNKGAQSMTFTLVNEIRTRFPDASLDSGLAEIHKSNMFDRVFIDE